MKRLRRYAHLLAISLRTSALRSLQYRVDFFVQVLMALFWSATALVPLWVLFSMRASVAGWSADEALVVTGFFLALKGILLGVVQPSLGDVVEHIRKGTLDFLLLKPVDAQFMLSTAKLELAHLIDVVFGFGLSAYCAHRAGAHFSIGPLAETLVILVCALLILYSLWIMVVSLAFHVVKIDNLSHLILSLFDAARFPSSVFRGVLSVVFTFVLPLSLMTTFPALATLGRLKLSELATACAVALVFTAASRAIWLRSIRFYTGAGG